MSDFHAVAYFVQPHMVCCLCSYTSDVESWMELADLYVEVNE